METEFRPTRVVEIETKWSKQSEERGAARYLVLPLLKEMAAAARLPGKALALLLLIHHRKECSRNDRSRFRAVCWPNSVSIEVRRVEVYII
jgi:hypothetical protein